MIFLAGLLKRSSISFIFVSIVRAISILAIIFMIAIELYLMIDSIKMAHSANVRPADVFNSDTTIDSSLNSTTRNSNTSSSKSKFLAKVDGSVSTGLSECHSEYISGSFVPKSVGGILFVTLELLFNIVILLLCLLSEISPPRIPEFFAKYLPPLGQGFGVGILGSLEIYIASITLSHKINKISLVSAWMLFVIGALNVLLGIVFGARIRAKRSLLDAGTNYAKKVTHLDDIETGFKLAKKGKKKMFKNLRTSQISRPKVVDQSPMSMAPSRPMDISRPIIGYTHSSHMDPSIADGPSVPAPIYNAHKKA